MPDPDYKAKRKASRERLKEYQIVKPSFQNDKQYEIWLKRWAKKNGVKLKSRKERENNEEK